jgi:hypothetical protein
VKIRFACPVCESPGRAELPGVSEWQCPACDHIVPLAGENDGRCCAVCGNHELYRKKDFPHWLGMSILVIACLASIVTYWLRRQWLTWSILIGSAIIDGLLYLLVGDVTVCYRCQALHRELPDTVQQPPFELGIAERYRQERIRHEQLKLGAQHTREGRG